MLAIVCAVFIGLGALGIHLTLDPVEDVPVKVQGLLEERRRIERELSDVRQKLATGGGGDGAAHVQDVGGVSYLARALEDVPAKDLRGMADALKKQVGSGVVAITTVSEGKASLVVGVTEDLVGQTSAVDLVRVGVAALGGKGGGGRPDMAQGGGPDGGAAQAALDAIDLDELRSQPREPRATTVKNTTIPELMTLRQNSSSTQAPW